MGSPTASARTVTPAGAAAWARRRQCAVALALSLVLAPSGCGSSARPAPTGGPAVFAASCSACHSLVGNESRHKQGGDLLGFRMSRADVLSFTRVMPGADRLSAGQLQAVTDYVFAAQRRFAGTVRGAAG